MNEYKWTTIYIKMYIYIYQFDYGSVHALGYLFWLTGLFYAASAYYDLLVTPWWLIDSNT